MKRFFAMLMCLLIFCACAPKSPQADGVLTYSALPGTLFPFYCTDENDRVWRVEKDGAYCLGFTVTPVADNAYFRQYDAARDTALFAASPRREAGELLCTLLSVRGHENARTLAENVKFSSLRGGANGALLYTDAQDTLYLYTGQALHELAHGVAQAEFLSGDTCVYRLRQSTGAGGELSYPVYAAAADFNRYLTDAAEILSADVSTGRAYLIRERRQVQKRTAQASVALCSVCDRSDVLFELPAVLLSQFENAPAYTYLLCCDEQSPTLQYRLLQTDGAEPVLISDAVSAGQYVAPSGEAYAYETLRAGKIERRLLTKEKTSLLSDSAACALKDFFVCSAYSCRLENNTLYDGDTPLSDSVASCRMIGTDLLCFSAAAPPYAVSLYRAGTITLLANDVSDTNWVWTGSALWYNSGADGGLVVVDAQGGRTAVLSSIDAAAGMLCADRSAAVVKDGQLYLSCEGQLTAPGLTVKHFFV